MQQLLSFTSHCKYQTHIPTYRLQTATWSAPFFPVYLFHLRLIGGAHCTEHRWSCKHLRCIKYINICSLLMPFSRHRNSPLNTIYDANRERSILIGTLYLRRTASRIVNIIVSIIREKKKRKGDGDRSLYICASCVLSLSKQELNTNNHKDMNCCQSNG